MTWHVYRVRIKILRSSYSFELVGCLRKVLNTSGVHCKKPHNAAYIIVCLLWLNCERSERHLPGLWHQLCSFVNKTKLWSTWQLYSNNFEYLFFPDQVNDFMIVSWALLDTYRICLRNLRTFFPILAAEKSGCVKYGDFFCGGLDLGFILV